MAYKLVLEGREKMENEKNKPQEKNIPFWIEVLGLGIFIFLFTEIGYPLIFGAKSEALGPIFIFLFYLLGSFITTLLIRFYKCKIKKVK